MVVQTLQHQLDFIFLVYGLAFVLLASNALSLRRQQARGLLWGWLALSGLVHAAEEWMEMYALGLGGGTATTATGVALHAASFALLLEFGRSGLGRPGPWIHLPLLAAAAAGGWAGLPGLDISVRYALGLTGGLAAAAALLRAARAAGAPRRWLGAASALSALYAVAVGAIVPPAPIFPASPLNESAILAWTGIPINAIRCAVVLGLAAVLWGFQWRNARRAHPEWPWKAEARRAAFFVGLLGATVIVGGGLAEVAGRLAGRDVRERILERSRMAAAVVSPESLGRLSASPSGEVSPEYARLRDQLAWIQDTSPNIRRIYLFVERDRSIRYAADSVLRGEFGHQPPGAVCDPPLREVREAFATGTAAVAGPFMDERGPFFSGLGIVRDPASWQILGVLGVDHDAARWMELVAERRTLFLSIALLVCVLVVGFFSVRQRLLESTQRLAASEQRMGDAQAVAHIGSWTLDPKTGAVTWSDELCRIYGYPPGSPAPAYVEFRRLIHPDDWDRLDGAIRTAVREGTGYEIDLRVCRPDGTILDIVSRAEARRGADGTVASVVGTSQDVTELRRDQAALRRLSRAVEQSPESIVITDREGCIEYVNPKFCQLTGYEAAEAIGQNPRILKSGTMPPEGYRRLWETILAGDEWRGELCNRKKNGDLYWESAVISPVKDAAGRITHFLAVKEDITDRRRFERALRESAEKFHLLFDGARDPILLLDEDNRFSDCNAAAVQILGLGSKADVIGLHPGDLSPVRQPDDRLSTLGADEVIAAAYAKGSLQFEWVHCRRDHAEFIVDASLSVIPRGDRQELLVHWRDITERKRAEMAVLEARQRYEDLVNNLTIGVYRNTPGPDGRFLEANPAIVAMFEADSRNDILKRPVRDLYVDPAQRKAFSDKLKQTGFIRGEELELRTLKGRVFWAAVSAAMRRDREGQVYFDGVIEDITERKRAQDALREAKEAAETATHSKSDFLARMSHELRTPLNSVIGFSNILLKNKARRLDAQEMTYLDRVRTNALHLLGLINDILDLSKVEAGRMKVELGTVALDALVRETLALLDGQAQQKRVRLVADVPPGLAPLSTDAIKLKQILINLAGNAIKFSENGTVTVRVAADPATSAPARIDVVDTGIGIPAEKIGSLFRPFEQGDSGTSRKFGGTGLGLAICKSFGDLLGYRLSVRSETGKGSTFSLWLAPAAIADDRPAETKRETAPLQTVPSTEAPPTTAVSSGIPTLAGRTVLVIDDEADARFLQAQALEGAGCRILTAASGPEGLMLAAAHRPDIVLLDLLMPGMDGWEVLRRLKEDPALRAIPVVAVSVVASERRASLLGTVDRVDKPVDRDGLMAALGRALRRSPARVLVVDDDADDRRVVREHLAGAGYDVREAADGSEALAALEACAPDLVLLDLVMPGMDGTTFLAEIRRSPRWSRLPVVVMTAKRLDAEESLRLAEQASTVLKKGEHTMDDIRRALESALRPPGAPAPAGEPASPAAPPPGPARPAGARVLARRRLAAIVPGYLDNRRKDVKAIGEALDRGDFDALRILGHNMKGTGRGYGFDAVSEIGCVMEEAASRRDPTVIRREADKLETYLAQVEVVYD